MKPDFFSEELGRRPALLKRIVRFNAAAARTPGAALGRGASSSLAAFAPDAEAPWRSALARRPALEAAYADYAARAAGSESSLENESGIGEGNATASGFWDFSEPSRRLALLSSDALSRLGRSVAAAVLGHQIATVVEKRSRMALQAAMGEDLYRFAVLRGRFMAGSLADDARRWRADEALEARFAALPATLLDVVRSSWPEPLRVRSEPIFLDALGRVALAPVDRVERAARETAGDPFDAADPAVRRRVWLFMKKLIARELDPSWLVYFD